MARAPKKEPSSAPALSLLDPDHVHDLSRRWIDDQDHVVEHHDFVALEYRIDLHDLRRRIVKFDGVRNPAPDPDSEVHIRAVIAVDCAVANQDAVDPGPLLAGDAGEPSAIAACAANGFTFSRAAAELRFTATAFLTLNAAVLALRSGVALALALLTAFGLAGPVAFAIGRIFGSISLLSLALLLISVALGGLPALLLFLARGTSFPTLLG
jgi:hypothetical protein